jgi:hypothetical protein
VVSALVAGGFVVAVATANVAALGGAVVIDVGARASAVADRQPLATRGPTIGGCPVFPADNPWNVTVTGLPVHPDSAGIIARIQADGGDFLHPDFGENPDYGIPFVVVPPDQAVVPITYTAYGDESDPGPFPVPLDAPVESGSDRHVIAVRDGTCELFELFGAERHGGGWAAQSGARFDLRSNALRPAGWTSADAAGLPILPGLARCEEVAGGAVRHALRVTMTRTQRAYIHPARHYASSDTDPLRPPMGLRLRLKASFDRTPFRGQARVLLDAMAAYGLLVADNGSNWFVSGAPGPCWDDDELDQLKRVPGTAFEVVFTGDPVR